jgi:hypothetical protein
MTLRGPHLPVLAHRNPCVVFLDVRRALHPIFRFGGQFHLAPGEKIHQHQSSSTLHHHPHYDAKKMDKLMNGNGRKPKEGRERVQNLTFIM